MNIRLADLASTIPFDANKLDDLLEQAGIDFLIATSKHNVGYLLGGYRFFFFETMDAIGINRYLPVFIYAKGHADRSVFIGNKLEGFEKQLNRFWTSVAETSWMTGPQAVQSAVAHIRKMGVANARIGVEMPFLPLDAADVLRSAFPASSLIDVTMAMERLRSRKSAAELSLLKEASERVVAAMQATFAACRAGMSKHEIVAQLRREETNRGLNFEYCLISAGASLNRAPSDQVLAAGDIISLDSGANYFGYIGDLCRMGRVGQPDSELEDLLGEIEAVQQAARKPIRAGARGGDVYTAAEQAMRGAKQLPHFDFLAHGMGLVSHEAPHLTGKGVVPYPATDEDLPLESGMVISIETAILHPTRGFIKLEDTVAVTDRGWEGFGDNGRGWNVAQV
ncbi:MAG: Xaa-Pro peptidase family protein [Beijerinckiaceae bacterium]